MQRPAEPAANPYSAPSTTSAAPARRGHPIGFWFIFWGELAERASYYGMRAILLFYMIDVLTFEKENASMIMHGFIAACYFMPLLGGFLADRFFGKYWTIVLFCVPYILGHVIIGIEQPLPLFIALFLLALGSGVTKPNISPLLGMTYDQQRPGQTKLRSDAFLWFYFSVNVGAFLSQYAVPWIRTAVKTQKITLFAPERAYQVAFLTPAVLMVAAFIAFAAGKPFYAKEKIERRAKTPEERAAQWQLLLRLGGLFGVVTFFWLIFDQAASTITLFAGDHLDLKLLGYELDADQVQMFNSFFILVLTPILAVLWRFVDVKPTTKMAIGFVLTGSCVAILSVAAYIAIQSGSRVSTWWAVAAYFVLTVGELLISPVGLELAFAAAPASLKGFVTAVWLVAVGVGNLITGFVLVHLYSPERADFYFLINTLIMVPVLGVFLLMARSFNALTLPSGDIVEGDAAA